MMLSGHRKQLFQEINHFYKNLEKETRWTACTDEQENTQKGQTRILNVLLFGPPDSPYEDGTFWIHIEFPKKYPIDPPILTMKTKTYHPIINKKGKICLTILEEWNNKKHSFIWVVKVF